jgi:Na+/H+ antiporter NhaD/arsenite permease-like protein
MADNPQALMAVSIGLILFCIIVIVLFIIFVHTMPGKIARKRGNPQAEAIEILSLLGLLMFPLWMAALVWAYLRPFSVPVAFSGGPGPRSASGPEPSAAGQPEAASAAADIGGAGD